MQFVNDDIDDELFRRAAEGYPLNTESGDWNKLQEKMHAASENNSNKNEKGRGIILFFVLMPMLLICTTYIKTDFVSDKVGELNKNTITNQATTEQNENKLSSTNKRREFDRSSIDKKTIANEPYEKVKKSLVPDYFKKMETRRSGNKLEYSKPGGLQKENKTFPVSPDKTSSNRQLDNKINNADGKQTRQQNEFVNNRKSAVNQDIVSNDPNPPVETIEGTVKKDSVEVPSIAASAKEKKIKKRGPRFYLGVQAGPDFSMVKATNVNKAGYSIGLLAGFNISRKFAIETGFMWDQKKYSSEGRYFNTEKLYWPHVTILDLSGYCNMFEIPINIRYNVLSSARTTWFANGGLSSYLMKKENYDYHYKRYGVYGYGNREYKNSTDNWLSVAHLSVGMQKHLGTLGDLRIEPYLKLPLKGVGIGSMPLTSTGIYLGITRPIR